MPPEIRDDRRRSVTPDERAMLAGAPESDERLTSDGRQRLLRGRRRGRAREPRRPGRRRRTWAYVVVAGAALLLTAIWVLRTRVPESFPAPGAPGAGGEADVLAGVSLYYGSSDGRRLVSRTRWLPRGADVEDRMRALIEALPEGAAGPELNPWPRETTVLEVFVAQDGTAYINLGGSLRVFLPAGDIMEWLVIASLTRTLCENVPSVRGVRLLVDGVSSGPLRRTMPLEWTYRPDMFGEEP